MDYVIKKAEYIINKADLEWDFILEHRDTLKRVDPIKGSLYDLGKKNKHFGSGYSYFSYYVGNIAKDSVNVIKVLWDHMKNYNEYIPTSYFDKSFCVDVSRCKYGNNVMILAMNDSFSIDLYARLVARHIISYVSGRSRSTTNGHLMGADLFQITDSINPTTIELFFNAKDGSPCIPRASGCKTVFVTSIKEVEKYIQKTNLSIIDRKILNPELSLVFVYDITGRMLFSSNKEYIDISQIRGIIFVSRDRQSPQKYVVY
jgi:hypothetical protein